jgi:hypothetical protein
MGSLLVYLIAAYTLIDLTPLKWALICASALWCLLATLLLILWMKFHADRRPPFDEKTAYMLKRAKVEEKEDLVFSWHRFSIRNEHYIEGILLVLFSIRRNRSPYSSGYFYT